MRTAAALQRAVGAAGGSTLALALLVCGCVFAAMAGPALSLHARSQAAGQTMAGLPATIKTVQVNAAASDVTNALAGSSQTGSDQTGQNLTASQLAGLTQQVKTSLAGLALPLGPGSWSGLSAELAGVSSGAAASAVLDNQPPKLEVLYRDLLSSNAQLVNGSYSAAGVPPGAIAVAVTPQTAARFGLHPGRRMTLTIPGGTVTLAVTAIIAQRQAGSTFWTQDPLASQPSVNSPPGLNTQYWAGAVFADPGQLGALQTAFSGPGLELDWEFPLAVDGLNANQAQALAGALSRATTAPLPLTGALAPAADTLTIAAPLSPGLSSFLITQAGVETVLLLLSVSLIVVAAAVLLLAARMMVLRRAGELALLRARGGSLRHITALLAGTAVLAAGPAAVIGAAVAIAVIPGATSPPALSWSLAGITLAVALAGPALIAAWQYRKPGPAANPARLTTAETSRRRAAWRRPVAEVTACAACVAGLIVLRNQGIPAGGRVNLLLTVAPVLVTVPVVLITLRLYPLIVRGLLALSARGPGATGFVALSAAARSSLTGLLPAFALVLALSLATFAGMVNTGIARGETAASWNATGADVAIQSGPHDGPVTAAELTAITAVRGVTHATAVWSTTWVTPFGQAVTVLAVDPASYAAVTATTPFAPVPAGSLAPAARALAAGGVVPVLASPDAAALLGHGATQLTSLDPVGPFSVRVSGILASTPAQSGGTFIVIPQLALPGPAGQPAPSMVLASGPAIDQSQLSAVVSRAMPDSTITFRSVVLTSLTSSPLPHGAAVIVVFTLAEAAVLALLIVVFGLALGAADRELTLARLTVMGHDRATRIVLAEALPAVLAAVVAGAVCAVVLPHLIGSSIDLSAFTGTSAPATFQPDLAALGLPAAAVIVLAVAVLATEARTLRRHGIAGILRAN